VYISIYRMMLRLGNQLRNSLAAT